MQEVWVQSLGWEDPLEKEMATHSSMLAWEIPWTEEPGGLSTVGSQRVGHDWVTKRQQQKNRPLPHPQQFWFIGLSWGTSWGLLFMCLSHKSPQQAVVIFNVSQMLITCSQDRNFCLHQLNLTEPGVSQGNGHSLWKRKWQLTGAILCPPNYGLWFFWRSWINLVK